ncbi:MAG TPA: hypothetical protein VJK51_04140 [Candidatus Nanoarchaeia archaeon]|nr:hypothetical protein [Candidatus Nanoarchaeia archaeon]
MILEGTLDLYKMQVVNLKVPSGETFPTNQDGERYTCLPQTEYEQLVSESNHPRIIFLDPRQKDKSYHLNEVA